MPISAWLFDAYPHPRRSSLMVWVKRGGATQRLEVPYRPDFFVRADAAPITFTERAAEDNHRPARPPMAPNFHSTPPPAFK